MKHNPDNRYSCRYCFSDLKLETVLVGEMMYGTGEKFIYDQCGGCASLQLRELPSNMLKYYVEDYAPHRGKSWFKQWIGFAHAKYIHQGRSFLGWAIDLCASRDIAVEVFRARKYRSDLKVLDVGCGSGGLLKKLNYLGFKNLTGIDPYLTEPVRDRGSVTFKKADIEDVNSAFDVIILNHVIEHAVDPHAVLKNLARILTQNGEILIFCPVANNEAWEIFREHWVQIDAPRHLCIPSAVAIVEAAKLNNLQVKEVIYNSTEFQFIGSEQARKDIPLNAANSIYNGSFGNRLQIFYKTLRLKKRVHQLNKDQRGDQALFVLGLGAQRGLEGQ